MKLLQILTITLIISVLLFSCNINKQNSLKKTTEIVNDELRFYKIRSSMDATAYMYERFGKWEHILRNEDKEYIRNYVWNKIDLMENGNLYTVITGGIETPSAYFSSIRIIDSKRKSVISNTPQLTEYIKNEIKNHDPETKSFLFIKQNN